MTGPEPDDVVTVVAVPLSLVPISLPINLVAGGIAGVSGIGAELDAVQQVAGDHVSGTARDAADRVLAGIIDEDAVARVAGLSPCRCSRSSCLRPGFPRRSGSEISTPLPTLLAITLRAAVLEPPIVLFRARLIETPAQPPLGTASRVAVTPMKLPCTRLLAVPSCERITDPDAVARVGADHVAGGGHAPHCISRGAVQLDAAAEVGEAGRALRPARGVPARRLSCHGSGCR